MSRRAIHPLACLAALGLAFSAPPAHAYTVETNVSETVWLVRGESLVVELFARGASVVPAVTIQLNAEFYGSLSPTWDDFGIQVDALNCPSNALCGPGLNASEMWIRGGFAAIGPGDFDDVPFMRITITPDPDIAGDGDSVSFAEFTLDPVVSDVENGGERLLQVLVVNSLPEPSAVLLLCTAFGILLGARARQRG